VVGYGHGPNAGASGGVTAAHCGGRGRGRAHVAGAWLRSGVPRREGSDAGGRVAVEDIAAGGKGNIFYGTGLRGVGPTGTAGGYGGGG
jgi:hypothetical protein